MADLWGVGIDVCSEAVMRGRSWSWLQLQIDGLLSAPPQVIYDPSGTVHLIPQTRLGLALAPPDLPSFQLFKTTPSGAATTSDG